VIEELQSSDFAFYPIAHRQNRY